MTHQESNTLSLCDMFNPARTENTVLALTFARRERVRRDANQLEDFLTDYAKSNSQMAYGPPQILPVPDEIDPRIPRIVFTSQHGFSQIQVSLLTVAIQTAYSPDWQTDELKQRQYMSSRANLIWGVVEALGVTNVSYSSLSNVVRLDATEGDDATLMTWLRENLPVSLGSGHPLHTFGLRMVEEVSGRFYFNYNIENYRGWGNLALGGIVDDQRMSNRDAIAQGVLVVSEFNDRMAWNEQRDYFSSREATQEVITRGFDSVANLVKRLRLENIQGEIPA